MLLSYFYFILLIRHEKSVRFRTQARTSGHVLPSVRVACVARPILVDVSNARTYTRPHESRLTPLATALVADGHVSALRACACRWGGGILFAHEPHRASWCYVGWVETVTAPSACGHRSRVAPRHIWKGHMTGSGASGRRTGWLIPRECARMNACGGRRGTITRPSRDPTVPMGHISNRCTAARVRKAPDPPSSERTGTLFLHATQIRAVCTG